MIAARHWRRLAVEGLTVGLVYPLALLPVIAADTWLGEAEFLRQALYESKREVAQIFLGDWLAALPVSLACWLVMRMLQLWFGAKANWLMALVAAGGILASLALQELPMIFASILLAVALVCLVLQRVLQPD